MHFSLASKPQNEQFQLNYKNNSCESNVKVNNERLKDKKKPNVNLKKKKEQQMEKSEEKVPMCHDSVLTMWNHPYFSSILCTRPTTSCMCLREFQKHTDKPSNSWYWSVFQVLVVEQ
ncbi:hypothetical protein PV327_009402 [Microctonus hyperodae]|uniref:Uncharacterized protein n=1 Tax=Microctonus hyperodae TaxID=165561 RepID=A0AA39FUE2_MICHY|nr:hypothetical protein PV327_009402 [Microctonus hyperodae]